MCRCDKPLISTMYVRQIYFINNPPEVYSKYITCYNDMQLSYLKKQKALFDCWVGQAIMKDQWRCTSWDTGPLSVVLLIGIWKMLQLCVGSWATLVLWQHQGALSSEKEFKVNHLY